MAEKQKKRFVCFFGFTLFFSAFFNLFLFTQKKRFFRKKDNYETRCTQDLFLSTFVPGDSKPLAQGQSRMTTTALLTPMSDAMIGIRCVRATYCFQTFLSADATKWLPGSPAKRVCSACAGSNPAVCVFALGFPVVLTVQKWRCRVSIPVPLAC